MKHSLDELLNKVPLSNLKQRYLILHSIRVEFVQNSISIQQFIKKRGVDVCLTLLEGSDEKCLEVLFSILGNVCMNKEGSRQALSTGNLVTILSETLIKCNNSCKNRILRLAGNLMLNTEDDLNRFEELQHTICIILEKANTNNFLIDTHIEILVMLVRTIRIFWKHKTFANGFIVTDAIKKIMSIFVGCLKKNEDTTVDLEKAEPRPERIYTFPKTESIRRNKETTSKLEVHNKSTEIAVVDNKKQVSALTDGVMKLLSSVVLEYNSNIVNQILCDKDAAKVMIRLMNSKYRSTTLRIFIQFSGNPIVTEAIGFLDGVTILTNIIVDEKTSKADLKNCILLLSTLTNQSCNRLKIRQSGSFKKLIRTAMDSMDDEEIKLIMFTLYQFRFDPLSLDVMLYHGVIKVLIKHIELTVGSKSYDLGHAEQENKQARNKRKNSVLETQEISNNKKTGSYLFYGNKSFKTLVRSNEVSYDSCAYNVGSPCSTSSGYSSEEQDNAVPEYDYSPICSDTEEEGLILTNNEQSQVAPEMQMFDFTTLMQEDESNLSLPECDEGNSRVDHRSITQFADFKDKFLKCMLELFMELSRHRIAIKDFASESTLNGLIKTFQVPDSTVHLQVTKIFKNILSDIKFYVTIVQQNIIFDLFEKRFNPDCNERCGICVQMAYNITSIINCLSTNAISGYGTGELTHLLQKSDSKLQLHGSIMCLYLIKCRKALETILFVQGAFDIIIQFIKNSPDEKTSIHAVNGITMMAINLEMKIDQRISSNIDLRTYESSDWDCLQFDTNLVSFIASDGDELHFESSLLTKMSEVFATMFASSFKEANDRKVNLNYVKSSALKYFLKLLHQEATVPSSMVILVNNNMQDLLQAYHLSRLYLLGSLETKLYAIILNCINFSNAHLVVQWSLENLDESLFNAAATYYLACDIDGNSKLSMYIKSSTLQFRDQLLEKLKEIIMYYCNE